MCANLINSRGFSLVEILIALLLAGLVSTGIYKVYMSQNKSYAVQDRVAEMNQNLRAAMFMMAREIRLAGHNPLGVAGIGIQSAGANQLQFTMDITGGEGDGSDNDLDGLVDEDVESDGDDDDSNEDITYQLNGSNLVRNGNVLAEHIDALDFVYLNGEGETAANVAEIRAVQITVVARADFRDPEYSNHDVYRNQKPGVPDIIFAAPGDEYRRKRLTTQVRCRNLGL
jgi:type IV pilus assembly protein PilW